MKKKKNIKKFYSSKQENTTIQKYWNYCCRPQIYNTCLQYWKIF